MIKLLKKELQEIQARKKPVKNAGDYYDEKRREADEIRCKIKIARYNNDNREVRKLRDELERALYTGD